MTNITFKNGLPLLLQPAPGSDIGLVAADSGCCCPPPPPERCWCGSDCSYFIRVVEPLAVTNAGYDCVSGEDRTAVLVEPGLLQAIIPIGPGGGDFAVTNFSQAYAGPGLSAGVTDDIGGFPTFLPAELYYFQLRARRSASISVYCVLEEEQPKYYATIQFSVNVAYIFESLGSFPLGSWVRVYYGRFEVPSTCVVSPERECYPELLGSTEFRRINTPLDITLSGDGTSSLGSLTMTNDGGSGGLPPDFPYAKDALDAILEESSYTFRITARENCLPPCPVGCDTNPAVTVSWETITIPDDCPSSPCGSWADNDGTYVRVLRTASGDGLIIPSGVSLEIIDDACYLTGYVGTGKTIANGTATEGECRTVLIIWKWKLAYPNCDVASAGPYTLTPEFYSGYQAIFTGGSETNSDIFSSSGGCFSMSAPSVTLEFPP